MLQDTIVALSTAPGQAALAVVRVSGERALGIGDFFLRRGNSPPRLQPRQATLCKVLDAAGEAIEDAIVTWFAAPASYTGEDVLELSVHGGAVAARVVLERCLRAGARPAEPGEFTLRAFLAGRIDLSQAEAVCDAIHAETEAGLRLAHQQLSGTLKNRVAGLRAAALGALAQVEASIDFPDDVDDPDRMQLMRELQAAAEEARALAAESRRGRIYQEGVRLVIFGRPNVGKSTLLNALLRQERAIVTPIPGTTRDLLEETLSLGGIPIRAIDTAGLRQTQDVVERIGVSRALESIQVADFRVLVLDRSQPLANEDFEAVNSLGERPSAVVINKCDLPAAWSFTKNEAEIRVDGRSYDTSTWKYTPAIVAASVGQGEGVGEIEEAVLQQLTGAEIVLADAGAVSGARHALALERAAEALALAAETAGGSTPLDLVTVDLRQALTLFGEITGETASEELLHEIFSRFCIGK